ncbi:MAG: polyhydroxyalkanoic acid system family protein [Polyangiaceae bacterium]|nr:polyhydroxyalkanoic acid system family protein [Polyangiaceae bacterium]
MKHVINHHLDIPTAKKVIAHAFAEYQSRYSQYSPTFAWVNDRRADVGFNAKGIKLKGAMEVADKEITLDLDVPFLLKPFQKKALEVIEREVKVWIGKANAGPID